MAEQSSEGIISFVAIFKYFVCQLTMLINIACPEILYSQLTLSLHLTILIHRVQKTISNMHGDEKFGTHGSRCFICVKLLIIL